MRNSVTLSVHAAAGLCSELTKQAGRRLLHLVNYRTDDPVKNLDVSMRVPAACEVKSVTFTSPRLAADVRLPFEVEGDRVKFTVPEVNIYAIVVVTTK